MSRVEQAFGTKLGFFKVNGHKVQLAQGTMTVPSSLAGAVAGTVGSTSTWPSTSLPDAGHRAGGQGGRTCPGAAAACGLPQSPAVLGLLGTED